MTMSKADRLRLSIYGILVFSGIAIVFALCIWVTYKLAKLVKSKVQTDEGLVSLLKKSLVNDKKMKSTVNHILNERKEDKYITNDAIPRRLLKITKNIETLGTALIVRLNYLVKSESISENSPINLTERSNKIMSDTNQNLENGNDINIRASSSIMDSKNIRSRPKSVIKSGTRENIDSIVDLNIDKGKTLKQLQEEPLEEIIKRTVSEIKDVVIEMAEIEIRKEDSVNETKDI